MLARAPRRLRVTAAGRVVIGLSFVTGFAAFNTGNNLLFFGWGLLLSAIVVSGVLSEGTLRPLAGDLEGARAVHRAQEASTLALSLHNRGARLPSYAVLVRAVLRPTGSAESDGAGDGDSESDDAAALRIDGGARVVVNAGFVPLRRGVFSLAHLELRTSWPFGFFEKSRRLQPPGPRSVVVWPARVDVGAGLRALLSRLGHNPAGHAGAGDELFALRPHKTGDDPRHIVWRRAARTGRLVTRESEAERSRTVVVAVTFAAEADDGAADDAAREHTLSVALATAVALLDAGHRVGLRAGDVLVPPDGDTRQRTTLGDALARLDVRAPDTAPAPPRDAAVIAVCGRGARPAAGAVVFVDADAVARATPKRAAEAA